jgi:hypothetical protein
MEVKLAVPFDKFEKVCNDVKIAEEQLWAVKHELDELSDKIVLDPSKDPDPWGHHNMSLSYRLRCMGWPEGLS